MLIFIVRRLIISVFVFFAATALVFLFAVNVGDPLAEARQLPPQAQEAAIEEITDRMNLDQPVFVRYILWLGPALTGDLGQNIDGQSVNALLEQAVGATLQLVLAATVLAIVIGIVIGVISALRQYSGLDLSVTFAAFLFYSLPVFWVGTLLKQFVAIDLNNWLSDDPTLPWWAIVGLAVFVAAFAAALVVGDRRTRLTVFGAGAAAMGGLLWLLSEIGWFADPGLGIVVVALTAIAGAIGFTTLVSGLDWNSPPMRASLVTAAIGIAVALLLGPVLADPGLATIGLLAVVTAAISVGVGWTFGGVLYQRAAIQASVFTGLFTGGVIFTDRLLQSVASYSAMQDGRPVSTIGAGTPNFEGTFWQEGLDSLGHLALPTLALMLISLATYTRYSRASMLEVMNQDYVRTARAKGLPERAVVTRHSLRNGLIPITTLTAYDIGTVMGGAVVTEQVFGWRAMGRLLLEGIERGDPMPIMAFFLVSGGAIVVFNMVADIAYGFLDPRIRTQ